MMVTIAVLSFIVGVFVGIAAFLVADAGMFAWRD